ncbi:MAG: TSUP family transporter [Nostoc sp. DedQUE12b]|uniref:TSUP family transporter n=1 Tax=Nostoc sp. DedQUE12b TaxID=3075398 RepID=UPI002AD3F2D4|nr:TSUP family transporter [Nostoc sp. DedQUE12b]MDZ8084864.1 TSUP family transporter [Nostoc sp. DedQUE12b]
MQACFLFFSAWLSGVLNSVAGGGGLIIFPALLLTGLPAINANATSTLASSTGYIASVAAYHDKLPTQQLSWLLGGVSVIGGLLGAVLLLLLTFLSADKQKLMKLHINHLGLI